MGVFVFVLVFRFFWPKWMPRCRPGRRRLAVAVVLHSVCTQLSTSSRFGRGGGTQTSTLVVLTLDVRRTIGSSASTSPRTSLSPSLQISRSPDLLTVPGCGRHRAGPWTARATSPPTILQVCDRGWWGAAFLIVIAVRHAGKLQATRASARARAGALTHVSSCLVELS